MKITATVRQTRACELVLNSVLDCALEVIVRIEYLAIKSGVSLPIGG